MSLPEDLSVGLWNRWSCREKYIRGISLSRITTILRLRTERDLKERKKAACVGGWMCRCFWDLLSLEQKDVQLTRLLAAFPPIAADLSKEEEREEAAKKYAEDENLRFLRHKRQKFDTWPPEKIEV